MGFLGGDVSNLKVLDFFLRLLFIPFDIAAIYTVVSTQQNNSDYGKLEFSDLVGLKYMAIAYLMVTSLAAQAEFLYLAYNGDQMVSWSEACDSYGKFCNGLKIALALHVIAICCFLVLAVISAYRVFRRFDPPFVPSKEGEQEMT